MDYANETLSDLVLKMPMASGMFRSKRLDFCCGGRQTLKDACLSKGIDLNEIIRELEAINLKENVSSETRALPEITSFIVKRYHDDLRERIPEILFQAEKVERVHASHPRCPHGLAAILKEFQEEMFSHMMKEESILFPLINSGRGNSASMPIKKMTLEHNSHGKELERIYLITAGYSPPEGACTTWRTLYKGLMELEAELMEHIHLENNILFPRALEQKGDAY